MITKLFELLNRKVSYYPDIKPGSKLCYQGGTSKEIFEALTKLKFEINIRKINNDKTQSKIA